MSDIEEIVKSWEIDEPKYKALGKSVVQYIRLKITDFEILPEIQYRTKELISIIKKVKKKQEEKEYSYNDLKDKLGIRIICDFQEDLDKVDSFLNDNFNVIGIERKKDDLNFNKLDYVSNHYDLKIKTSIAEFKELETYSDFIFEIQVRTLNQHAWSNTAHKLSYKQDQNLNNKLKRRIYRLLSLYEIADDEFSGVYKELHQNEEKNAFAILNKIEGKFFKYAKIDYDRVLAINNIEKTLTFLKDSAEIESIVNNIVPFIEENALKIQQLYKENNKRFHAVLALTQPEIFVYWYMLNKYESQIEDNWDKEFYPDDLEKIKTLWGKEL